MFIKDQIEKLLEATNRKDMTDIAKQKQIINAFFKIIQIEKEIQIKQKKIQITKNKGLDVILIDDYMFKVLSWSFYKSNSYDLVNIKSININNLEEIT
jgi:folate-dependent phosphoribosylglycinamide formyltransferase PurN